MCEATKECCGTLFPTVLYFHANKLIEQPVEKCLRAGSTGWPFVVKKIKRLTTSDHKLLRVDHRPCDNIVITLNGLERCSREQDFKKIVDLRVLENF